MLKNNSFNEKGVITVLFLRDSNIWITSVCKDQILPEKLPTFVTTSEYLLS